MAENTHAPEDIYAPITERIRTEEEADGVLVIVLGGKRGSGMSSQANHRAVLYLPHMLREIADQLEEQGGNA